MSQGYNKYEYQQYLLSKKWRAKADECKRLANNRCSACESTMRLEAHHVTYDNIYNESQEDLVCLCRSCHGAEHEKGIKKLNKRINIMDLLTIQSKICNSSKSIEIFRDILYSTDKRNIFDENITIFSKKNGYTRQQVTKILSKFIKENLANKLSRGVYMISPLNKSS